MTSLIKKIVKSHQLGYRILNFFDLPPAKTQVKYSYEDPEVVSLIIEKTLGFFNKKKEDFLFSESDLRMLAISQLANLKNGSVVIDFGGGAGHHYKTFKKGFPHINIKWIVVETKEMARQAKKLENKELIFVSSFKKAVKLYSRIDLIYSDSALQYCTNPIAILKMFTLAEPNNIFINRTMMSEQNASSFEQASFMSKNGPGNLPEAATDFVLKVRVFCETRSRYLQTLQNKYTVIFNQYESTVNNPLNNQRVSTFSIYSKRSDIHCKSKNIN